MIPYGKQDISQNDIDAVVEVLKSDFLTQGPMVPLFEKSLTDYTGANHALAMNSATSALHVACLALGVGPGDIVWTSPITFVASANCALYCGAKVDFVDIDSETYNISVIELEKKLKLAKAEGKLPKIVIPVHLAGQVCEMKRIQELSIEYGFFIIEDASHAIGGKYKGRPVGNCEYSDITIFSFHPVKIITTAEGGAALTNKFHLFEKMSLLRSHGITRDEKQMTHNTHGPWYYQQIELGFNYRMTELQAALGLSQMQRLDEFVKRRHEISNSYNELLSTLPLKIPYQHPDSYSGLHLYIIRLKLNKLKKSHSQIFKELREIGIGVNLHYIPVHTQPYYKNLGFKEGDFPQAESYYSEAISIPMYSGITSEQLTTIFSKIKEVLI